MSATPSQVAQGILNKTEKLFGKPGAGSRAKQYIKETNEVIYKQDSKARRDLIKNKLESTVKSKPKLLEKIRNLGL